MDLENYSDDILENVYEELRHISNYKHEDKIVALIKLLVNNMMLTTKLSTEVDDLRKLIIEIYNNKRI